MQLVRLSLRLAPYIHACIVRNVVELGSVVHEGILDGAATKIAWLEFNDKYPRAEPYKPNADPDALKHEKSCFRLY